MRRALLVMAIAGLFADAAYGANEVEAKGTVDAVTLYRGQALVTRIVSFDAPAGAVQLVVKDLPEAVLAHSLYANADKGVQVRAVRYRSRARAEAPKADVRVLDDKIREIEKQARASASGQALLNKKAAYLDGLERFVVPTAKVEMAKGVLNADTLDKLTGMMFAHRQDLAKQHLAAQEKDLELRRQLDLLRRKRSELSRSHTTFDREALVFIDKAAAGKGTIRLNYLVGGATWEPAYNLRAVSKTAKVSIEYTALARQMSGEDWTNVKLTLSAAAAQMVADGPALAPLRVRLSKTRQTLDPAQIEKRATASQRQLQTSGWAYQGTYMGRGKQIDANWAMNRLAFGNQKLELIAAPGDVSLIQGAAQAVAAPGLSANYKVEGRVTFASRLENQTIEISRFDLPAQFHYEAVPLLTEFVFRYARLTNDSKSSLLEAKSTVYLDGDFVGIGTVPMMARGQQATVGFGMDPQLRAWREFASKTKSDEWLGNKRRTKFSYRLVLHNYSDKPVAVRLLDRTPMPTDKLKTEVDKTSDPLSTDAEHVRTQCPRGILRWDVTVPAKATAAKPKVVEYTYTLTHDKDVHIAVGQPSAAAEAKVKMLFSKELREGNR